MIKIMFVCHGNICRSPMAEFVFKDMVKKRGLEDLFYISSSATSTEEIGNPVHHGTKNMLRKYGICTDGKYAIQLTINDYNNYDYLIAMDSRNITNMHTLLKDRIMDQDQHNKIYRLLDFTKNPRDIADPWYTGNFDLTYDDIYEGCEALLDFVLNDKAQKERFLL